jgi:hypothetical protein
VATEWKGNSAHQHHTIHGVGWRSNLQIQITSEISQGDRPTQQHQHVECSVYILHGPSRLGVSAPPNNSKV